jgi:hypothetical protein
MKDIVLVTICVLLIAILMGVCYPEADTLAVKMAVAGIAGGFLGLMLLIARRIAERRRERQ